APIAAGANERHDARQRRLVELERRHRARARRDDALQILVGVRRFENAATEINAGHALPERAVARRALSSVGGLTLDDVRLRVLAFVNLTLRLAGDAQPAREHDAKDRDGGRSGAS